MAEKLSITLWILEHENMADESINYDLYRVNLLPWQVTALKTARSSFN